MCGSSAPLTHVDASRTAVRSSRRREKREGVASEDRGRCARRAMTVSCVIRLWVASFPIF